MTDKTTQVEAKLPHIKEEVSSLADKIQADISKAAAAKTNIDNSLYEGNLPEGITKEIDNTVREYRQNFHHASGLSYGRAMVELAAKDKKLEGGNISIGMGGKDSIEYAFKTKEEFVNRMDKENPVTVVKHGYMVPKLTIAGTAGSSGQLSAVRKTIGALAAEKLAK